ERSCLLDELRELAPELRDVRVAGLQDLMDLGNVEQRQQQVLDGHELVPPLPCVLECLVKAEFEFAAQHDPTTNPDNSTTSTGGFTTLPSCTAAGAAAAARSW